MWSQFVHPWTGRHMVVRAKDPIIVVEYQDLSCLVDGTTRVNLALRGDKELDAIVLKVRPCGCGS